MRADWFKAESELLHPVHVRIAESDEVLTAEAEVPDFEAKDLRINVEPRRLTISGKKETKEEQKKGKAVHHEQCSNEILRVIDLPAGGCVESRRHTEEWHARAPNAKEPQNKRHLCRSEVCVVACGGHRLNCRVRNEKGDDNEDR